MIFAISLEKNQKSGTLLISPFKIDENYGEMTCYLAKESLPVVVPTEPICGTTSPLTLAEVTF